MCIIGSSKLIFFFFYSNKTLFQYYKTDTAHYTLYPILITIQNYLTHTPPQSPPPAILSQFKQKQKREKKEKEGCYDDSKVAHFSLKNFILSLVHAI